MADDAIVAADVTKTFRRKTGELVTALDAVSLAVRHGRLTALVGADGAGKTTLIRLATGLLVADGGRLEVLGVDAAANPGAVQERVGYMPQRFGLYEDLTVRENLDLYADLHGIGANERQRVYPRLMEMTALGPFQKRLAGRLSGGMKQKLGLACTLVRTPELLVLDEPTAGVDPLSRRELWAIVRGLVNDDHLTVLLATSYLDEAERSEHSIVMHAGRLLAASEPAEIAQRAAGRTFVASPAEGDTARALQARLLAAPGVVDAVPTAGRVRFVLAEPPAAGAAPVSRELATAVEPAAPEFENGFMVLLHAALERASAARRRGDTERGEAGPGEATGRGAFGSGAGAGSPGTGATAGSTAPAAAVEVRDLVRKFGEFTAVDHVSFEVRRGEVFGLLGPNGAGKTTTFRMLCGLLPASGGTLRVAGADLRTSRASARQRIGYVAQKFSLYGTLTVAENLAFFARAYGLRRARKDDRIAWALREFGLERLAALPSGQLPGGFQRRLAMAAALLHEPDILFLDEPTSGADPMARREFWTRITALAERGVTVIVTTHFMEEAEYCDRALILDAGRVLAEGTPSELRGHARTEHRAPTMEDAFVAIVEAARRGGASRRENAA